MFVTWKYMCLVSINKKDNFGAQIIKTTLNLIFLKYVRLASFSDKKTLR